MNASLPAVEADLTVIGAGLLGPWHLTGEAEGCLRRARVVYCSVYNEDIADRVRCLNAEAPIRFEEEQEYRPGMFRPAMYRRMANAVVEEAARGPGVVALHPGSAMVVDLVTQFILEEAAAIGLRTRIVPGISSIECVLSTLQYDASDGLQIVLAQKLVLGGPPLSPKLATILLQPAYYDTLFFAGAPRSLEGRFDELQRHLSRIWTLEAPMALLTVPTHDDRRGRVFWFRLANLGRLYGALSPLQTLFVPPARALPDDRGFAARLRSWTGLLSRVERGASGELAQHSADEMYGGPLIADEDLVADDALLAARWEKRGRW